MLLTNVLIRDEKEEQEAKNVMVESNGWTAVLFKEIEITRIEYHHMYICSSYMLCTHSSSYD